MLVEQVLISFCVRDNFYLFSTDYVKLGGGPSMTLLWHVSKNEKRDEETLKG